VIGAGGQLSRRVEQLRSSAGRRPEVIGVGQHTGRRLGGDVSTRIWAGTGLGIDDVARQIAQASLVVRDNRVIGTRQPLPKLFVGPEQEQLVLLERAAQRSSELIAPERRGAGSLIEEVPGIHGAVAEI